jgi:transcriptional regulator with XRE-family HTH domain
MESEDVGRGLALRLREARASARLRQVDVAEALRGNRQGGLTRQAISAWERAESLPTLHQLIEVCQLYGTSADYLLFGVRSDYGNPLLRRIFAAHPAREVVVRPPAASASS